MSWRHAILVVLVGMSSAWGADVRGVTVVAPPDPSPRERLAAAELVRYVYLRTGHLPAAGAASGKGPTIILRRDSAGLGPQQYALKTEGGSVAITGGDDLGLLYGAYRYCERLGVRFYLHGDVIPDERLTALPVVNETGKPLFKLRGLNPWGSHPFGMDAWGTDDYKAVFTQMAKMRMNFLGIHCYQEGRPYAEPTVWLGTRGDFGPRGEVTFSYPSRYYNTLIKGAWGPILPGTTGNFRYGGAQLFADDAWAPGVMRGLCPIPATTDDCHTVFNRMAVQLREAFGFARGLGVKTCLGTETPLTMPKSLRERFKRQGRNAADEDAVREVYEGMFRRIAASHHLDYFWLWTPESWNYAGNKPEQYHNVVRDVTLAQEALKASGASFTLATCGWVLGPQHDRAAFDVDLPKGVPMGAISRQYGHARIDPAFGMIRERETWAIPWLESDEKHGLAAMQPFVGRVRRDAADALANGSAGLMGLHWRTEIIAPNIAALAAEAWDQQGWNPSAGDRAVPLAAGQQRYLPCDDFYADWAVANFGSRAGPAIGRVFAAMDGLLPMSVAGGCPSGALKADPRPWEQVMPAYACVEDLARLRPGIEGPGNLDRFDFWLNTLRYHRSLHEMRCALGAYDALLSEKKTDAALEAYRGLVALYGETYRLLLSTVNSPGGLACVVNLENHAKFRPFIIDEPAQRLARAMGRPLPEDIASSETYQGRPRLVVPTVRTLHARGEEVQLQVMALDRKPLASLALFWRPFGGDGFEKVDATWVARSVYRVHFPKATTDYEYHLVGVTADGERLVWPPTAPTINQTVVVLEGGAQP